ncbi:DnaJ sub C member 12 [Coemansia sp. RSA 989]|nr:DnaJ sub C member 12 [Coemansia sp. RSA 989]
MEPEDYYDVLGCNPRSDMSEIHRQFRKRALALHPDKHTQNTDEWNLVREAYEVLGNAGTRAQYDRWQSAALPVPFSQWQQQTPTVHWASSSHRYIAHTSQPASANAQPADANADIYALFRSYQI